MPRVASYLMNPAEDTILFGDDLHEGMWVLRDDEFLRAGVEASEEVQIRAQRFCRITRLQFHGQHLSFIGEWVDGYQKSEGPIAITYAWIVKKDSIPAEED